MTDVCDDTHAIITGGRGERASRRGGRAVEPPKGDHVSERPAVTRLPGKPNQPLPPTGRPARGQIVRIHSGQSHGFIRAEDSREVFFHRTDTAWGTFNQLLVGDTVAFELIEDRCSGPRATRVRRGETTR
jgi:cold shock CspA family protein